VINSTNLQNELQNIKIYWKHMPIRDFHWFHLICFGLNFNSPYWGLFVIDFISILHHFNLGFELIFTSKYVKISFSPYSSSTPYTWSKTNNTHTCFPSYLIPTWLLHFSSIKNLLIVFDLWALEIIHNESQTITHILKELEFESTKLTIATLSP